MRTIADNGTQTETSTFANLSSSSSSSSYPDYVTYLAFCQNVLTIFLQLSTIVFMGLLVLFAFLKPWKIRVSKLSGCMLVYLAFHTICCAISLPYEVFRVGWWVPPPARTSSLSPYNPYVLFWLGVPSLVYGRMAPVPIVFLTLDRIFALQVTIFTITLKQNLPKMAIATSVGIFLLQYGLYMLELPLNVPKIDECEFPTCQMLRLRSLPQLAIKTVFGSANLLLCIVFLWMLKTFQFELNVKDRVVRWSIFLEVIFDLLPTYSGMLYSLLTGVSWSNYMGEYLIMFVAVETAIGGVVYFATFYNADGLRVHPRSGAGLVGGRPTTQLHEHQLNAQNIVRKTTAPSIAPSIAGVSNEGTRHTMSHNETNENVARVSFDRVAAASQSPSNSLHQRSSNS